MYRLTQDGVLGDEIAAKREVKDGYIREFEVDVALSNKNAYDLYMWMKNYFEPAEEPPSTDAEKQTTDEPKQAN